MNIVARFVEEADGQEAVQHADEVDILRTLRCRRGSGRHSIECRDDDEVRSQVHIGLQRRGGSRLEQDQGGRRRERARIQLQKAYCHRGRDPVRKEHQNIHRLC